jgi:DNA processing protein
MDNKLVLIALNQLPGIGPKTIARLLYHWPNLVDLIEEWQKNKLRVPLPQAIHDALALLNFDKAKQDLAWSLKDNCSIMTICDEDYPALLKQISDAPPVLYIQGHQSILAMPKRIAIVGARQASLYGKQITMDWSSALAQHGFILISGMAIGIDTLVHQACVKLDTPTIAVLGSGLQHIYPKQNTHLAHQIQENGVILSEFSLKTPPNARHFPRRNRIISGLALSTLVVEAAEKSGTTITALHALEQNRDVFVLPGQVGIPNFLGNHRLIQQGAKLVTSYQDILQEYVEYQ